MNNSQTIAESSWNWLTGRPRPFSCKESWMKSVQRGRKKEGWVENALKNFFIGMSKTTLFNLKYLHYILMSIYLARNAYRTCISLSFFSFAFFLLFLAHEQHSFLSWNGWCSFCLLFYTANKDPIPILWASPIQVEFWLCLFNKTSWQDIKKPPHTATLTASEQMTILLMDIGTYEL